MSEILFVLQLPSLQKQVESCLNQSQGYIAAKLVCAHNSAKDSHWVENNSGKVEQCIHKGQMCTPEGRTDSGFEGSNDLKNRPEK